MRNEKEAISQIVDLIRQGRDSQRIQEVTREVIVQSGVRFGDDIGELDAIYTFVKGRIRYIRDPYGKDVYQSAVDTLEKYKTADCEDFSILISSMVQTIGYPATLKLVSISGTIWDHIYPLAGIPAEEPSRWVAMDATLIGGRLGQEPERVYEKQLRLVDGIVTERGESYIPPADWKRIILNWMPAIIFAPIFIYLVSESLSKRE